MPQHRSTALLIAALAGLAALGVTGAASGPAPATRLSASPTAPTFSATRSITTSPKQVTAIRRVVRRDPTRITGRAPGSVAYGNQAAVAAAYESQWLRYFDTVPGFTGSEATCNSGTISTAAVNATRLQINFVRSLAGLSPVAFTTALNQRAQASAVLQAANGSLSHHPPRSWRCWTRTAADASGSSNLDLGDLSVTGTAVSDYLADPFASNVDAGHRRWILYPGQVAMGTGFSDYTNALYVCASFSSTRANPAWVSWPSRGYFPIPMEPGRRWSLSSGSDYVSFAGARVTAKVGGRVLGVKQYRSVDGYGKPTLVWDMPASWSPAGNVAVSVTGITNTLTHKTVSYHYWVRLFRP